ncbi:MAG: OB-fold domain-containing protein [Pseudomonadota bacterium]
MSLIASEILPFITPETQPFWDSVKAERPALPRCNSCNSFYFPPAPVCPICASRDITWTEISGDATLYSYMITENPWPEWNSDGPMSVAHIVLKEGPRLISTVVDCPQTPAALRIDMALKATFRLFGDRKMLCFKPVNDGERLS